MTAVAADPRPHRLHRLHRPAGPHRPAGLQRPHQPPRWQATFAAVSVRNFRIYMAGQSVASTGTWMQSIAQDWLVLQLTHSSAAVGITMACQFLPVLVLGMYGGMIADRYPKRRLLAITQSINGALATLLAVLTITGEIRVGLVWLLALAGGLVFVVDNPTRQVFVNEVVPARYLRNAIALNAAVFQTTRLVGPAVAGVLISQVGCGWAFAANAVCYLGPLTGLALIRTSELVRSPAIERAPGQLRSALQYVAARPHVAWTIALVGVVGTFGLNFPVVLTAMASTTFHGGPSLYGLFNVMLALGSVTGALIAGGRSRSGLGVLVVMAAAFGVAQVVAALAPDLHVFLVALVAMGVANLAFQAMANSSVQLWVDPEFRGRVMGLYLLVFVGGTPVGAPIVGWITEHEGARIGMAVCGLVPALVCAVLGVVLSRARTHAPSASRLAVAAGRCDGGLVRPKGSWSAPGWTDMTTRALVLAGGGLAGIAWELGVLLGLADSGVDVADTADLVVGTSAGSTVAAQITSGETLEASFARQLEPTTTEITSDVDVEDLQRLMIAAAEAAVDRSDYWRRVGAVALATSTVPEAVRHAVIAARLPETGWPRRRLLIPAIDVDGSLKVFDAGSGVPLVDAVAASCAVPGVWPPVTIGGHRYVDGGVRSATNADLSAGADVVVVLTPAFPGLPNPVPDELLAAGIPASVVVAADADTIAAFGTNWLDPATRRPSALAGRALGRAEAARVAETWNG